MSAWWLLIPAAIVLHIIFGRWPHETGPVYQQQARAGACRCKASADVEPADVDGASIIHLSPIPHEAETIEFPLGVDGWDADSILRCVAEIEAL